jgi:pyruvate-ferredoxin/flavodoxin oxidoreductase
MVPHEPVKQRERANWEFFRALPPVERQEINRDLVKDVQLLEPLFEFSGACAGCGETPYLRLVSQLFGDRALIANATGCSSIYGGNLPTTPWSVNREGRGPGWANSLFEDNAEFGLGMRVALDQQEQRARVLLAALRSELGEELVLALTGDTPDTEGELAERRARVAELRERLAGVDSAAARELAALGEVLVPRSVWIVGGDGWAYDIGFGGLDHVIASGRNVNLLVLDTEVYSNTGGQMSKATPMGAVAKFAAGGKRTPKKDLGLFAMSYGRVYVAQIAIGADDSQALRAIREAEAFDGPSLVIAYSHCIAHGYDLVHGLEQQKLAVQSGYWPLFRHNPERLETGENPFVLDSKPPSIPFRKYAYNETRYTMLTHTDPAAASVLLAEAEEGIEARWRRYEEMSRTPPAPVKEAEVAHA